MEQTLATKNVPRVSNVDDLFVEQLQKACCEERRHTPGIRVAPYPYWGGELSLERRKGPQTTREYEIKKAP